MGLLKDFFSRKQVLPSADLSVLKVDMHSHLIPGIDDGAKTIEDSIALIRALKALGYKKLVTTPHIMSDFYKNTPEIIEGGLIEVQEALKREHIDIELEAAAEYYLDFDFEVKLKEGDLLKFGDNYVLFELSMINAPEYLERLVFEMKTNSCNPVLAHVERYPYWHNNLIQYEKLKDMGVLLQLNITSLGGQYGPQCKKAAKFLIDNNMIDFLGTDCHNLNYVEMLKRTLQDPHLHKLLGTGRLLNAGLFGESRTN